MEVSQREHFGRVVRTAWVAWAREQTDPKPSWLVEWDELTEPEREVDRQIAAAVLQDMLSRVQIELDTIEKNILYTAGFLSMIRQITAIHPRLMSECEDHENEMGEALEAIGKIAQMLGEVIQP